MSLQINKAAFFDREAVIKDAGAKMASAFAQFGRYATKTASNSMRKAGKKKGQKSEPGEPPRTHAQQLLKKHIYFDWDSRSRSVVMGPAKMKTKSTFSRVPHVLEYGGATQALCGTAKEITEHGKNGRKKKRTIYVNLRLTTVHIAARPYMGPAVAKAWQRFKWPKGTAPTVAPRSS